MRCWEPADAPLCRHAIDSSLPELRPWIPWAKHEPSSLPELKARLAAYRRDFLEGRNALYAVLDRGETEVLGGAGLYRRVGPGALEVGYWIRSDQAGRGLATEAAGALTGAALATDGIDRIEIHCDPRNVASAAIPRKLGYRYRETSIGNARTPDGEPRDTMIWELTAAEYRARGSDDDEKGNET
ncbi:MAG TPA: GNAT family N-acetyltransferase [Longimicrobiales bacterium]|nr:GNAT family N-acetyltransferase [Longimicrobiales bacterium]